ncbi:hypothetical protein M5E88_09320 [Akkermansia muciniphila]|nr:hypothetical protein M5E88_09320 [Akkermansia muciniphila]
MPQFKPESFAANKDLFLLLRRLAEEKQAAPAQIPWRGCSAKSPGSFPFREHESSPD